VVQPFFEGSLRCVQRHRIYEAEGLPKKKERKNKIKDGGTKKDGKTKIQSQGKRERSRET